MPETALAEPSSLAPATVRQVLHAGVDELALAGCETPRLDAELLLCAALGEGWSRTRLVTADRQPLEDSVLGRYRELLVRRRAREPVAYIVGFRCFRRITLAVDRRVLIPRPETELLVEVGLRLPRRVSVADVGTGSGAVALALKQERSDLELTGIDISADALDVARENARCLGLEVRFAQADLLDRDGYEAVLANLPYVPTDGEKLAPEIGRYEPACALFGGDDGLDIVRRLISRLAGSGVRVAALELDSRQASAVARRLERAGFGSTEILRDLAGHERVVVGRRCARRRG